MIQGKTIVQAEIDTACELADFYRHNVQFAMVSELKSVDEISFLASDLTERKSFPNS